MEAGDFKLRVDVLETVAEGVVSLRLSDPQGNDLPEWEPGAHIDIVISEEMIRQYSLCGDPQDRKSYRIGVLNEVDGRGGSKYIAEEMKVGDEVVIRGPRNHFELLPSKNYIFIAGGIGVTPLVAMTQEAARQGVNWKMLYGGRMRTSMAFVDELTAYGDNVTISPEDETGLLDLASWLSEPVPDTLVYCCGPEPLLEAVEKACDVWPAKSLHVERFTATELAEPVRSGAFQVILAKSGKTLTVPPDKSILEVLREAKVPVLSSCSSGTCGSCETAVLDGIPDHRDVVLDEEEHAENDCMMVCVSRALTDTLTLDL